MRLYLLPISTRRALVYCQRSKTRLGAQSSYTDRISHKAAETWAKWETHDGGWQKKVTEYGNKALQRIPFEEWCLKSVPPLSARRKADDIKSRQTIEVVYPGNVVKEQDVPAILRKLGTERQTLHRQRAWWSLIATPFTIPFGLIPVLPNLPFFYLAYRSWSHFKALWGSQHLVFLADKDFLKPIALTTLERIYSTTGRPQYFLHDPPSPTQPEMLLIDESSHLTLSKDLEVPELAAEVERAVKQVRKAIKAKADMDNENQKAEKKDDSPESKEKRPPNR